MEGFVRHFWVWEYLLASIPLYQSADSSHKRQGALKRPKGARREDEGEG